MDQATVSQADILRARADPRLRQVLLARSLAQLLGSLHRIRQGSLGGDRLRLLSEGALMAVELADRIGVIDENLRRSACR